MADLSNLTLTDLYLLESVSRGTTESETHEVAQMVGKSGAQVIRRAKRLRSQGLLMLRGGELDEFIITHWDLKHHGGKFCQNYTRTQLQPVTL